MTRLRGKKVAWKGELLIYQSCMSGQPVIWLPAMHNQPAFPAGELSPVIKVQAGIF
jgi:hypothetical protein